MGTEFHFYTRPLKEGRIGVDVIAFDIGDEDMLGSGTLNLTASQWEVLAHALIEGQHSYLDHEARILIMQHESLHAFTEGKEDAS